VIFWFFFFIIRCLYMATGLYLSFTR
jgi:hypothetical protein